MKFGQALDIIESGGKVFRNGWHVKGRWLIVQRPGPETRKDVPYIYMEYPKGHELHPEGCKVPWLPSQAELLAKDWDVIC